jgi:hypothetical protein
MLDMIADKFVMVTPPAAIIDNTSPATTEIDTAGFRHARILVLIGATDIALTALKVTESDSAGSGHADVTGLIYGTSNGINGSVAALPSATDDNKCFAFEIDLRGRKRYLDVVATVGDGAAGAYVTIIALLSRAEVRPMTAAERGYANILRV